MYAKIIIFEKHHQRLIYAQVSVIKFAFLFVCMKITYVRQYPVPLLLCRS